MHYFAEILSRIIDVELCTIAFLTVVELQNIATLLLENEFGIIKGVYLDIFKIGILVLIVNIEPGGLVHKLVVFEIEVIVDSLVEALVDFM